MRHHTFRITFGFILVCIIVLVASGIFFLKNNPYVSGKFFGMYARRIQVELQYALHSKDKNAETTEKQLASSVAVLAYHGIGTKTADSVSSKKIRKELIDLKIAGYETISLDQYEQFIRGEITLPEKSFLLTFDEGIKSNYFAADPILKALNYQAVLFANPSLATDLDPYYLSEWELSHLSKTNRWSLQLYNDGLDFAALSEAKSLLMDKYGSSVTAMSYSSNALSDAASLVIVPFVFNQQWPKNNFGARTNYPSVAGVQFNQHSYESVRLPVALLPTDDVRMLLNATLSSPLPYFEKLDNPFKWVASVGDSLIENNTLMFSSEGNIATAYFDGSFGFNDYQYQMTLGSDVPESHSVSLIGGYKNAENYISCQFANGSASIKMVANNKETTVLNSLVLDKQLI
ncbi:MAG TPA: polysaccharide deacetylase family protein, partial [Candidatus Paceibacterota bacterium]|nr:polysaccharide deacetylase family protein [Candidatus Paceibacterota bacterium]